MSKNLRDFTTAAYTLDAVVQRVPADTWRRQSPCEDWTAGEVLGHVVWALRRIAASAEGLDAPPAMAESEVIGSDPVATWNEALHTALAALDRQGVLGRVVTGSFGTATIDAVLGFYPSDLLAHAWDIATTAGQDPQLPAALCERFAVNLAAAGSEVRGPGRMAEAVTVPADADAAARFIAQTGRTP